MSQIDEILNFNKKFVEDKQYELFASSKYPNKKLAVISCMDTRLTELLPAALNCKNGDVKIIKNAGGVVTHPFGSVMRSLMVAIYQLDVEEVLVIGHTDCGMQNLDSNEIVDKMRSRNISQKTIDLVGVCGIDIDNWLKGFSDVTTSICETVNTIRSHPFIPKDVKVYGLIIDPSTGKLELLSC